MVAKSRGKSGSSDANAPADWIENELRETKARLHKVESELAQALKQTYGLEAEMRKLMETLAVAGSVESALGSFREEVRQLREQASRLQDRQSAITARVEQVVTQRQSETGRDRQEFGLAVKQIETLNRVIEQNDGRMKALEEAARHLEEEVAGGRLANQSIERAMEELNTRAARTHEATLRLDHESARFAAELGRLEQTNEALTDRLGAFLEQLRRALERMDKLEALSTFADETRESLQRASVEREQMVQRVAQMEHLAGQLAEASAEFGQTLAKLEQRSQAQGVEMLAQAGSLQDLTDQTKASIKKIYTTLLRQGRRRSEALNNEIKDLTQGEIHAND
jgi:chromosome segregation ATPase